MDLYCDNNETITQSKETRSLVRSKHILQFFHLIYKIIDKRDVKICKVSIDNNIANPLTNPLA